MSVIFKEHIKKFVTIADNEFPRILAHFNMATATKKKNLLTEGQLCKCHYFVLTGCLRKFFIDKKGVEHTTDFAIERWWLTDNAAYEHRLPTEFYIQAVEPSTVLCLDRNAQDNLVAEFPQMERYFRFIYQRAYAAAEKRIKYLYEFSKEEYFDYFNERFPSFIQRVPQYLVASYLGFTPEYLSGIRKKKRS